MLIQLMAGSGDDPLPNRSHDSGLGASVGQGSRDDTTDMGFEFPERCHFSWTKAE